MLNKFAVPGFKRITAFGPVQNKFRHRIGNKLRINTSALENLQGILIRLPVVADRAGFFLCRIKRCAFQLALTALRIVLGIHPLLFNVAEEAGVPVVAVSALFLALQNKGVQLAAGKAARNAMLLQPCQGVFLWLPALRQGLFHMTDGRRHSRRGGR